MSLRDVFGTDLALLHAPSVYDFRTSVIMHGPIADAVPSTNEFTWPGCGLILAAALCYRFARTGGIPMLKMMGGAPGTEQGQGSDGDLATSRAAGQPAPDPRPA